MFYVATNNFHTMQDKCKNFKKHFLSVIISTFVTAFTVSFSMTASYDDGGDDYYFSQKKYCEKKWRACNFEKDIAFLSWKEKFKFIWFIWILSGSWGNLWHSAAFVRIGQQDLQRCKHSQFLRSLSACVPFCLCLSTTFLFVCLFVCLPLCLPVESWRDHAHLSVSRSDVCLLVKESTSGVISPDCVYLRCLWFRKTKSFRCHAYLTVFTSDYVSACESVGFRYHAYLTLFTSDIATSTWKRVSFHIHNTLSNFSIKYT